MLGAANSGRSITQLFVKTDNSPLTYSQNPNAIACDFTEIRQTTFISRITHRISEIPYRILGALSCVRGSGRESIESQHHTQSAFRPPITPCNSPSASTRELRPLSPISVDLLKQRIDRMPDLPDTYDIEQKGLHDLLVVDLLKLSDLLMHCGVKKSILKQFNEFNPKSSPENIEQQIKQMEKVVQTLKDSDFSAKRTTTSAERTRHAFNCMIADQEKIRKTYIDASEQFRQKTQEFNEGIKGLRTDFGRLQKNLNDFNKDIELLNYIQRQLAIHSSE